jgi:hypothetical protein
MELCDVGGACDSGNARMVGRSARKRGGEARKLGLV